MGRTNFWNRVAGSFSTETVSVSRAPLVELYGSRRILIENHCGVREYTDNLICVNVNCGQVCIGGYGLNLALLSRDRLVICGKIETVHMKEA